MLALSLGAATSLAMAGAPSPGEPVLADFSWLAGHWRSQEEGRLVEELWLPSRGGLLVGVNRTTTEKGSAFEFLRIDELNGLIAYLASPGGRPGTVFPLKSLEGQVAEFENPNHDFPKRIRYERTGDTLTASIHGDGDHSMSWTWRLAKAID